MGISLLVALIQNVKIFMLNVLGLFWGKCTVELLLGKLFSEAWCPVQPYNVSSVYQSWGIDCANIPSCCHLGSHVVLCGLFLTTECILFIIISQIRCKNKATAIVGTSCKASRVPFKEAPWKGLNKQELKTFCL